MNIKLLSHSRYYYYYDNIAKFVKFQLQVLQLIRGFTIVVFGTGFLNYLRIKGSILNSTESWRSWSSWSTATVIFWVVIFRRLYH